MKREDTADVVRKRPAMLVFGILLLLAAAAGSGGSLFSRRSCRHSSFRYGSPVERLRFLA